MSQPNGWYYITHSKGEVLAHHCTRCHCSHIIGDGCAARVFHCGKWEEYAPEQPTGLRAFFGSPAELPRVRFKERPVRSINVPVEDWTG
jgi:hypothetical protein